VAAEFPQVSWDQTLVRQWLTLLELAVAEDLGRAGDLTTQALLAQSAQDPHAEAALAARQAGVAAGLAAVEATLQRFDPRLQWRPETNDGRRFDAGERLGRIEGPAAAILRAERILLNFLGRLCGIATVTRRYVDAVAGTGARIFDTRKTTPGWRLLEKYAVRCGGGWNHRLGLDRAVLIKDNHLALLRTAGANGPVSLAEAVARARRFLAESSGCVAQGNVPAGDPPGRRIVEVEVDTLEQLDEALRAGPDLVLLDNMSPAILREAVRRRNAAASDVELEASGGITLENVREVAETGVERISIGALTHSAASLDLGLDWL